MIIYCVFFIIDLFLSGLGEQRLPLFFVGKPKTAFALLYKSKNNHGIFDRNDE